MPRALAPGAGDAFAGVMHRLIRRAGGRGNHGRLVVRLDAPPDAQRLERAWSELVRRWRPLGARYRSGWRAGTWVVPTSPAAAVDAGPPGALGAGLDAERGRPVRLCRDGDTLVLDWDHRLCDARGAQAVIAALAGPPREAWWRPGYREVAGLPATLAGRGRQARAAVELLRPLRRRPLWRPPGAGAWLGGEPVVAHRSLGPAAGPVLVERARLAVGRFAETPYLLAALAGALEAVAGIGGDLVFPLAVDLRRPGDGSLANLHGFAFLACPAGLASRDPAAAAAELKAGFAAWTRADGERRLLCSLGFFPRLPLALARHELGHRRAGVAASCLVANTGAATVPATLLGRQVLGVDHAVTLTPSPGLAVLFRRDARGPGFDLIAAPAVARRCPPRELAQALSERLLGSGPVPA